MPRTTMRARPMPAGRSHAPASVQRVPSAAPPSAAFEDRAAGREQAARYGHHFDQLEPPVMPDVPVAAAGSGHALPTGLRTRMEQTLGADLGNVRVHEGSEAEAVGAIAYTRGADLHFAPGRYNPGSPAGRELLAHELAHVLQQREGRVATPDGPGAPVNADPALEAEAEAAGRDAAQPPPSAEAGTM